MTGEQACGCYACIGNQPAAEGTWLTIGMTRMILCSECGNKRCPHATNHEYACTGSNEPGQVGSRYGTAMHDPRLRSGGSDGVV